MANTNASTIHPAGPTASFNERRTRLRLRDLCDEVLASYRLASDRDLFTSEDRIAASKLIPLPGR